MCGQTPLYDMGTSLNYAQTSSYDVETSLKEVHTSLSDVRFANHIGADQPAHPRRLVCAFVVRLLDSNISRLATSEISNFSVAEQAGFESNFIGNPEDRFLFLAARPNYIVI